MNDGSNPSSLATQPNNGLRVAPVAVSAIPPAFAHSLMAKALQKALGSTPNGCAKCNGGRKDDTAYRALKISVRVRT